MHIYFCAMVGIRLDEFNMILSIYDMLALEDVSLQPLLKTEEKKAAWSILKSWIWTTLHPEVKFHHPCLYTESQSWNFKNQKRDLGPEFPSHISDLVENIVTNNSGNLVQDVSRDHILTFHERAVILHRNTAHSYCLSTRRLLGILKSYSIPADRSLSACSSMQAGLKDNHLSTSLKEYICSLVQEIIHLSKISSLFRDKKLRLNFEGIVRCFLNPFLIGVAQGSRYIADHSKVRTILYDQFMDPHSLGLLFASRYYGLKSIEIVHGSVMEPNYLAPLSLRSLRVYPDFHLSLSSQAEYLPLSVQSKTIASCFRTLPGDPLAPLPLEAKKKVLEKLKAIMSTNSSLSILYVDSLQPLSTQWNMMQVISARRMLKMAKLAEHLNIKISIRSHPAIGTTDFQQSLIAINPDRIQLSLSDSPLGRICHGFDLALLPVDTSSVFELLESELPFIFLYDEDTFIRRSFVAMGLSCSYMQFIRHLRER